MDKRFSRLITQDALLPGIIKERHLVTGAGANEGDLVYSNSSGGFTNLAIGSTYQLLSVSGGVPVWVNANRCASTQSSPSDPSGTTSTVGIMMGLAGSFTPLVTGRALIILSGSIENSASGDGAGVQLRYGTGTAPSNADALTGTAIGGDVIFKAAAAAQYVPFSLNAIVSSLTIGTAIWIDTGLKAITAGTATILDLSLSVVEF